jgi:hypothetical protein
MKYPHRVTIVRVREGTEHTVPDVPAFIQPRTSFFEVDLDIREGDIVLKDDPRGGVQRLSVAAVKVYDFGARHMQHLEVKLLPAGEQVIRVPEAQCKTERHYQCDVAVSYAGEDKERVEPIALLLEQHGLTVFYAGFSKAELWGKDLPTYLAEVFKDKARYCIVFLSARYAQKAYPTHELRAALARAMEQKREYLLPIRLDDTEVPGVLPTVGYLDLRQESAETIVQCVLAKLGRPSRQEFHAGLAAAIMAGRVPDISWAQDIYAAVKGVDWDDASCRSDFLQALHEFRGHAACGNRQALGLEDSCPEKTLEHLGGTVTPWIVHLESPG